MKILIIDDDIAFAQKIEKDLFNVISISNTRTEFKTITADFDKIDYSYSYDIVFLDIDLSNQSGIEIAKNINRNGTSEIIIFVTSHSHLVFDALAVHPYFFVRKSEYEKDMKIVYELFSNKPFNKYFIGIKNKGIKEMINISSIIYIEARDHCLNIVTRKKTYFDSSRTLLEIYKEIEPHNFIRVHKSYIINFDYLERYDHTQIWLGGGISIQIGKKYRNEFVEKYMEYLVK